MSGTSRPRSGDNGLHFKAARIWLDRAEKQFSSGESVIAAATLMLAQAELKIIVEEVASGAVKPQPVKRGNPFRLAPVARDVVTITALAACLMIGIFVGRAYAPIAPWVITEPTPIAIAQAPSEIPNSPAVTQTQPVEPVETPTVESPD